MTTRAGFVLGDVVAHTGFLEPAMDPAMAMAESCTGIGFRRQGRSPLQSTPGSASADGLWLAFCSHLLYRSIWPAKRRRSAVGALDIQ
jgi:hypothetical protein